MADTTPQTEATYDDSRAPPSSAASTKGPSQAVAANAPLLEVQRNKAAVTKKNINAGTVSKSKQKADVSLLPITIKQAWRPKPGLKFQRDVALPKDQFILEPTPCVEIDSRYVEKFTAYDFLLMRKAAFKAGLWLNIVSAFRTWEDQERLFYERLDPQVRATKGYASPPGWGQHHTGQAIDIGVNLTIARRARGETSPIFTWLTENADLFGFVVDRIEPWHWEHREKKLVGRPDTSETSAVLAGMGITAAAAVDQGGPEYKKILARDRYEQVMAYGRSLQMMSSTRTTFQAEGAASNHYDSAATSAYVAQSQRSDAAVTGPQPFDAATLDPFIFDFTTGLWGDEKG